MCTQRLNQAVLDHLCPQARSLLTSHEDFTTLQFHSGTEIQKPGLVWAFLKRSISEAVVEEVQRMSLTADGCSAVFDVPSSKAQARSVSSALSLLLLRVYVWCAFRVLNSLCTLVIPRHSL